MGFAFKANTNDTRESPAIKISTNLLVDGAKLSVYDPKVKDKEIIENIKGYFYSENISFNLENKLNIASSYEELADGSDAILILTEWDEFKKIDWQNISKIMRKPSWIFDCRDILDFTDFRESNLNIWKLGFGSNLDNLK